MRDDRTIDSDLSIRLREGDEDAFRQLYSAYRARLYSFLVRLSGHPALSEELCQEVWLRLVTHPPVLQPGMPLGPWLFRVARNLFISYLRSREYDDTRTAELTAIRFRPSLQSNPWDELAANEMQQRLFAALDGLPLPYRESILLVAGAGLTPQQAAEVLDLPAPTFRKRLSRARELLAKRIRLAMPLVKEAG
jgi:RNA polymerase sigma-70 factor (ECF subfamily)